MSEKKHIHEHIEESPILRHPVLRGLDLSEEMEGLLAMTMIIYGLACLLCSDQIYGLLPYLLGVLLILLGLLYLVHGIQTKEYLQTDTSYTAQGGVYLLLGLVLFFFHAHSTVLIGAIWGMLGLYKGVEMLNVAFAAFCSKNKNFLLKLMHGALDLFLGVTVLLDPATNLKHHVLFLGLELLVIGAQILISVFAHRTTETEKEQIEKWRENHPHSHGLV